jgi:drug/metabolite transporter (DMT)-like permease
LYSVLLVLPWDHDHQGSSEVSSDSFAPFPFRRFTIGGMQSNKDKTQARAIAFAVLAASLYALSTPFSKLLLDTLKPSMMAALLYLGAGVGMSLVNLLARRSSFLSNEKSLDLKEWPSIIGMILLDIAAPLLLMFGLSKTTAENASLLNNFEIVATGLIAFIFFREAISKRLWLAIALVTVACVLLSLEDVTRSLSFSIGSIFILLASLCWGLENNLTRRLSAYNPLQIVVVKGFGSGFGALLLAALVRELGGSLGSILAAMLLGFVAFGLSIYFYVRAQRDLGAAKTSAFYSTAPFIGVILGFILFRNHPGWQFYVGLILMMIGTYLSATAPFKTATQNPEA